MLDFKTGRKVRIDGRRLPKAPYASLRLSHFLDLNILPEPAPVNHWNKADPKGFADPLGNDDYGDCCFAGIAHFIMTWLRNSGSSRPDPNKEDTLTLYTEVEGFNRNDPSTDVGGDLPTVLAYVKKHGFYPSGNCKIAGHVKVDPTNILETKIAISLFGGVYAGLFLPDSIVSKMTGLENGFVWGKGSKPNDEHGHCVYFPGYNQNEVICSTWGLIGGFTWEAFSYYFADDQGGEVYAPLSTDWINTVTHKSPSGFNYADLEKYLMAMG